MTRVSVRSTRQRAAISTLLETLDEFRSAQELHDELRRRGENIGGRPIRRCRCAACRSSRPRPSTA
ncbi:transcriptional repressor, partial [Mycobacterium sp. 1245852.3]|uniref:transcriptional repressor n=1 Tax=Mycobacterium sp. 1245852.3 TaxID=1856860 RepID=UPI000B0369E8